MFMMLFCLCIRVLILWVLGRGVLEMFSCIGILIFMKEKYNINIV